MKAPRATPIDIVEDYFDLELERKGLKRFDDVPYEQWIDFAQHYQAFMDDHFPAQFLSPEVEKGNPLRLYFEPRMSHEWTAAVESRYSKTPLLGLGPDPAPDGELGREEVSRMLDPLKKHLLLANSLYLRDSFYYCFDAVAESVERERWLDDPNTTRLVELSVARLKRWLPVLIELRALIESRALVFMPYYLTPSFPYDVRAPALEAALEQVRIRPEALPEAPRIGEVDFSNWDQPPDLPAAPDGARPAPLNPDAVIGAWLNSQLLGLDPVFPDRAMFDYAAGLYFEGDPGPGELTSDLISIDILPFDRDGALGPKELVKLRKNEGVFTEVREAVVACREFLEEEIGPDSTQEGLTVACRGFLRERLDRREKKSVLRFIDKQPVAGMAVSIAVGAALISATPAIGLIGGALLSPDLALWAKQRVDPKRRAIGRLQALL